MARRLATEVLTDLLITVVWQVRMWEVDGVAVAEFDDPVGEPISMTLDDPKSHPMLPGAQLAIYKLAEQLR